MLNALARYGKHIASVVSGEAFRHVPKPLVLYQFNNPKAVDQWHVHTDSFFGGKSSASLELSPSRESVVFSGHCTLDQQEDAEMKRAGYCNASSKVTSWGNYYSLERYTHLVYTVKGDGRAYIANLRTETLADGQGDVWQAPFKTRRGEWIDVYIPFGSFMMTVQGKCTVHRHVLPQDRVISVGVAMSALDETQPPAYDVFTRSASTTTSSSGGSDSSSADGIKASASSSSSNSSSSSSSSSSASSSLPVSRQDPLGFDFRLEIQGVRAEFSVDPASEM